MAALLLDPSGTPCSLRVSELRSSGPCTRKPQSTRVTSLPNTVCLTAEKMLTSRLIASGQI